MTNKLKYLTKISLDKKIKTKWFLIANIILLVIIAGIINIDSIIKFFGGDFDKKTEKPKTSSSNRSKSSAVRNVKKFNSEKVEKVISKRNHKGSLQKDHTTGNK